MFVSCVTQLPPAVVDHDPGYGRALAAFRQLAFSRRCFPTHEQQSIRASGSGVYGGGTTGASIARCCVVKSRGQPRMGRGLRRCLKD